MPIGKFIDTLSLSNSLLAGETVNCCQHTQDLKAIGNSRYRNRVYFNCMKLMTKSGNIGFTPLRLFAVLMKNSEAPPFTIKLTFSSDEKY